MENQLERITTEYSDVEDRIRLTGEVAGRSPVTLWLTQRLLQRLLPHLLHWLAQRSDADLDSPLFQSWAQEAALAELKHEEAVVADGESAWLVWSVDVSQGTDGLTLTFKSMSNDTVTLVLTAKPLRQWLAIVFTGFVQAEWPLTIWPDWMRKGPLLPAHENAVLH